MEMRQLREIDITVEPENQSQSGAAVSSKLNCIILSGAANF